MKVHEEHKSKAPKQANIALIIVSTSRYEEFKKGEPTSDQTIPLVKEILKENQNLKINHTEIVSDSAEQILNALNKCIKDKSINAIIYSGGTGLSPKDITYETIKPLMEKELTGFGEIFRYLSYQEIGSAAIMSRATAGKISNKAVIILPGSPNAVKLAFEKLIIPELTHITSTINKNE